MMQLKSRAGRLSDPRAGYVLIELVAALALTGLFLALVLPNLATTTTRTRLHMLLSSTVAGLRDARTAAIAHDTDVAVMFDAYQRVIDLGSKRVPIPSDVAFSITTGGSCVSKKGRIAIVFRGDGTNCGGVLHFVRNGEIYEIRINWATGTINIVRG
jgi:general secretion pathway protein H